MEDREDLRDEVHDLRERLAQLEARLGTDDADRPMSRRALFAKLGTVAVAGAACSALLNRPAAATEIVMKTGANNFADAPTWLISSNEGNVLTVQSSTGNTAIRGFHGAMLRWV